jgi:HlyD family secretion protein
MTASPMTRTLHLFALSLALSLAVVALPGCGKSLKLKGARAALTRVESTVTTTSSGTVEAEQQAILGFGGAGRVQRIRVRAGDVVRKGQVLAELENADLLRIRQDTEHEVTRAQELFTSGLMSRVALDDARRAFEIARMNLERSLIRAPFDGLISEMNLKLGETAQPGGTSLLPGAAAAPLRIIDQKERLIKGSIDELDLGRIRPGAPARIRILAARPEPFTAKVVRVVPFVSTIKEQDRTSQVEFRLTETPPSLLPAGASADIEVIVEQREKVLAVPARTILGLGERRYAFVLEEGRLKRRDVKLGLGNFERREILSGIREGDTVVFPPDDAELKDGARAEIEIQAWP